MSDQCNATIRFKNKRDADKFKRITGVDWEFAGQSQNRFEVDFSDCDYAMVDELRAAAAAGIEFIGNHGHGDNYPRESFVAIDRELTSIPLDFEGYETARLIIDEKTGEARVNPDDVLAVSCHVARVRRLKQGWERWAKRAKRGK
jgi:hypothetical protein